MQLLGLWSPLVKQTNKRDFFPYCFYFINQQSYCNQTYKKNSYTNQQLALSSLICNIILSTVKIILHKLPTLHDFQTPNLRNMNPTKKSSNHYLIYLHNLNNYPNFAEPKQIISKSGKFYKSYFEGFDSQQENLIYFCNFVYGKN